MTEEEWSSTTNLISMLLFVREKKNQRKIRLLDCSCAWHLEPWFTDPSLGNALERAERYADGKLTGATLDRWARKVHELSLDAFKFQSGPKVFMASRIVSQACIPYLNSKLLGGISWIRLKYRPFGFGPNEDFFTQQWLDEMNRTALSIFRDIFGNPFRPITLDPYWLSSNVAEIARTIYEERAFDKMPILADALQDAGCDSQEILDHCRGEGPHVRGCWVVDLILGKE